MCVTSATVGLSSESSAGAVCTCVCMHVRSTDKTHAHTGAHTDTHDSLAIFVVVRCVLLRNCHERRQYTHWKDMKHYITGNDEISKYSTAFQ